MNELSLLNIMKDTKEKCRGFLKVEEKILLRMSSKEEWEEFFSMLLANSILKGEIKQERLSIERAEKIKEDK